MSKLILGGPTDMTDKKDDVEEAKPMRLPPLRKFVVARYVGERTPEVVTGHVLEAFGNGALAIVEYRQVPGGVISTFPRIFNTWVDLRELETNSLKIN